MTRILGDDLARVTGNVIKFVNPKSIYLPGEILFDLTNHRLRCYSSDDYIALTDTASTDSEADFYFVLDIEDVKKLEKFARDNKKYWIEIRQKMHGVAFDVDSEAEDSLPFSIKEFREEPWNLLETILFDEEVTDLSVSRYTFRPERLTKLSQLKHDKDAPFDVRVVNLNGFELHRFRIGETLRGVVRPVDRSVVDDKYLW